MGPGAAEARPRPYRGLSPKERRAERRRRLLDAALELYGTEGYRAVSIERLCAHAGVTARHLYEEFPAREALLTALFDETAEVASRAVGAALAGAHEDPYARAEAGIGAFVHAMLDDPRRARVLCVESIGVSAELEAHRRTVIHAFARVTQAEAERFAEDVPGPQRDFSLGALALVGGTNELIIDWVLAGGRAAPDELIRTLVDIFLSVGVVLLTRSPSA